MSASVVSCRLRKGPGVLTSSARSEVSAATCGVSPARSMGSFLPLGARGHARARAPGNTWRGMASLSGETIPILASRDIAETTAFYERLGFEVRGLDGAFGPAYLRLRRDDVELHFVHSPDADPAESHGGCYLRLADAQGIYDEWEAQGVPGIHPPRDTPWGMREFFIVDPSGNLLRIGTRLDQ